MSSENLENAAESLEYEPEPIEVDESFENRLRILHAIEDEAWSRYRDGYLTADEATEAVAMCRMWIYEE